MVVGIPVFRLMSSSVGLTAAEEERMGLAQLDPGGSLLGDSRFTVSTPFDQSHRLFRCKP